MGSPISPDIVYKLRGVGDPALSPDGSRLAYTQSWVEQGDGMEARSRQSKELIGISALKVMPQYSDSISFEFP